MCIGRLELILGSMYSGKTTELIRLIRRCECINKKYLLITHSLDQRYGLNVASTHDKIQIPSSISCNKLNIIKEEFKNLYEESEFIFIEEGQFFDDLEEFCKEAVDIDNKNVTVIALDGDYNRKPWDNISKLIPLADNYIKLTSLCKICNDGTPGIFSKRIIHNSDEKLLIGSNESYIAVCRKHYFDK